MAVIHQYTREMMTGCGKMILGSDSHTRYGALGTMAIGEGGPEIVKQLLKTPMTSPPRRWVLVWLTGTPPTAWVPTTWPSPSVRGRVWKRLRQKQNSWNLPAPAWPTCPWITG